MATEAELRTALRQERELVAGLNAATSASYLKQRLADATSTLNRVEDDCLATEIMRQPRTPDELAWWLNQTQKLLEIATLQRKHVEDIIAKFGPDGRSF